MISSLNFRTSSSSASPSSQLITDPEVLFLDEPTSGLDSSTSDDIMALVRTFAVTTQTTVCSTIHSPSARTFDLFDDLLLLTSGRTVYFGHLNDGSALAYFKMLGFIQDPGTTAAEWLVEITGGGTSGKTEFGAAPGAVGTLEGPNCA